MVYFAPYGVPTLIHCGVYAVRTSGYGCFLPNMSGSITSGSVHCRMHLRNRHSVWVLCVCVLWLVVVTLFYFTLVRLMVCGYGLPN